MIVFVETVLNRYVVHNFLLHRVLPSKRAILILIIIVFLKCFSFIRGHLGC